MGWYDVDGMDGMLTEAEPPISVETIRAPLCPRPHPHKPPRPAHYETPAEHVETPTPRHSTSSTQAPTRRPWYHHPFHHRHSTTKTATPTAHNYAQPVVFEPGPLIPNPDDVVETVTVTQTGSQPVKMITVTRNPNIHVVTVTKAAPKMLTVTKKRTTTFLDTAKWDVSYWHGKPWLVPVGPKTATILNAEYVTVEAE